jgi:SAM-dependent methyltransferase
MRPDDLAQLKDDLRHYCSEFEDPALRGRLVDPAWPRLLGTLDLIPARLSGGDMLELGASPYFLSLCLRRLCRGRLAFANYFGTGERHGTQRLAHRLTGDEIVFDSELFNVETDEFPYPAESFDVVIFSELIEHLALNPVWVLSQIHRVLRPGGVVVITTPNALSLERLDSYLCGEAQSVDRFVPAFGYGARHNREYRPRELRVLLEGTGFAIEEMVVRDLEEFAWFQRRRRAVWKRFLRRYSPEPRETHIFLRARRGERFRWHFPPNLFDHIDLYRLVREPYVEMGVNDEIQCDSGWSPLESWGPEGAGVRRVHGTAKAWLKAPDGAASVAVEMTATAGRTPGTISAHVTVRGRGGQVYADAVRQVARGGWQTIEVPLDARPLAGDEIEVSIDVDAGDIPAPVRGDLRMHERGGVVRRIALRGAN